MALDGDVGDAGLVIADRGLGQRGEPDEQVADRGLLRADRRGGTGVLLDLGHPVTVVSAEVTIGAPGAWVELRGGTSDSPDALPVIGGTKDAGATTTIRPQQTPIRYLLIWFTTLPQTPIGNYQASIQNVTIQGHS